MKQIPLSQGKFATVDDEDFDELNNFKWYAVKNKNTYYAVRNLLVGQRHTAVLMHRAIMKVTDTLIKVDHIDHDGLFNSKGNLRLCSKEENNRNRKKSIKLKCRSPFKGVSLNNSSWFARIYHDGKVRNLGSFRNEKDAAEAYNVAAKKFFGDFACLNEL